MEINPLLGYINGLRPLPPINGDNSVLPPDIASQPARDFSFELAQKLNEGAVETESTQTQIDWFPIPKQPLVVGQSDETQKISDEQASKLMAVCKDIEGFFLSVLLKSMGESFSGSDLFSQTYESSVYHDMFFTELADSVGSNGPGLGIAQALFDDIILKATGGLLDEDLAG